MKKLIAALLLAGATAPLAAETFQIDPAHSKVMFRVRHIVSKVTGRFDKFSGTFDYVEGKPESWKASAKIDAASINTDVAMRDRHLRGKDFFNADKCPALDFQSTKAELKDGSAKLYGSLTMHCITKPVTLDLDFGGTAMGPDGKMRAGVTATGRLNRKDFDIVWNKPLDKGGVMLGEDVEIIIEIEGIAQKKN